MKVAVTTLACCVAALLALGLVMLYSSSMVKAGAHDLMMQLIWCAAGLVICAVAATLDYQWLNKFAWPVYSLALLLLALVFVPNIGHASHGAHRWIQKAGFTLQPSEFAKLALVITLAWYCAHSQRQMQTWKRGIFLPGLIIGLILGLIFIEPDRGATILLAAVSGSMLLVAGVRWRQILVSAALVAGGLAVAILRDPMRMGRIFAWLHPEQHLNGAAYQAQHAMYGLGAGGLTGVGLGNGMQKFGYLSEIQTDFIFANIGEELGLIATLLVVVAFVVIAICGIYIALNSRDTFGFLLATGVTLLISLQAAINIGVVTSALPNKGLPLPFISYGGSNLLAMLACVGILFSVARLAPVRDRKSEPLFGQPENPFAARAT
jgi:cell division protein FtsW